MVGVHQDTHQDAKHGVTKRGYVSRIEGTTERQVTMADCADFHQAVCVCHRHRCHQRHQLQDIAQWTEGFGYRGPWYFVVGP